MCLTVSGANGSDTETKTDYILVGKVSILESTFDEGVEGWWIYRDGTNLTHHADGGNPGGYISADDLALDETWRFVSPCTWSGDWRSYLGGTISFDLKVISGDTNRYYSGSDVIIDTEGTGHYAKWSSGIEPKVDSWTHYEVRPCKNEEMKYVFFRISNGIAQLTKFHAGRWRRYSKDRIIGFGRC